MKILAFVDTHSNIKMLKKLMDKAKKEKADAIICAGDISVFQRNLGSMLKCLNSAGIPSFIIHGNHETPAALKHFCSRYKNIRFVHRQMFRAGDIYILGHGGGGFSQTDLEFEHTAKKFSKILHGKDFILVTHGPPYKTNLDRLGKTYCGSKSVRKFIERQKPLVAISGHIHETEGRQDKIGKTIIINPGAKGMIIEV